MWRTPTMCLLALVLAAPAAARHRHHHHGHHAPQLRESMPPEAGPTDAMDRRHDAGRVQFVPPGWSLQEPDPKWTGKRFVSPDGRAWFAAYSTEVAQEPASAHLRSVAFADGETVTFIRGESDWIVVAGTKGGDRMFYRKAVIACGGRIWHHIAFEYPIELSRHVAPMLRDASTALDGSENDGCEAPVAKTPATRAPATTTGAAAGP